MTKLPPKLYNQSVLKQEHKCKKLLLFSLIISVYIKYSGNVSLIVEELYILHSLLFSLHSYTIFFLIICSSFLFLLFKLYFTSFPTESNNILFLAILSIKLESNIWSNKISWSFEGKDISDNFLIFFLKLYLHKDIN